MVVAFVGRWAWALVVAVAVMGVGQTVCAEEPMGPLKILARKQLQGPSEWGVPADFRLIRTKTELVRAVGVNLAENIDREFGRPRIDFGRYMLAYVAPGSQRSSGYKVHILEVATRRAQDRDELCVRWTLHEPQGFVLWVITTPAEIAMVERADGEVSFERVSPEESATGEPLASAPSDRVEGTSTSHSNTDDYVTPDGQLQQRLVLKDTGGFFGAGTGWKCEVERSGEWLLRIPQNGKPMVTTGRFTKSQLAELAEELVRYDLLGLPKEVTPMTVADGIDVVIQFGDRRFVFHAIHGFRDLPKPDAGAPPGRFAGIAWAVQRKLP